MCLHCYGPAQLLSDIKLPCFMVITLITDRDIFATVYVIVKVNSVKLLDSLEVYRVMF